MLLAPFFREMERVAGIPVLVQFVAWIALDLLWIRRQRDRVLPVPGQVLVT